MHFPFVSRSPHPRALSLLILTLSTDLLLSRTLIFTQTPIAIRQHGYFSWIWMQRMVTDDELMHECGLDALCFFRILKCGFLVSLLGIFNAIWLMPLYAGAETSEETFSITDSIIEVTISHVSPGSKRLIATAIAAYFIFGYTMYLIFNEFDWFIEQRQKFLKRPLARNYAIYMQGIPPEYRTNASLANFFRQCYSEDTILEATVRVNTPKYEEINGVAPTHRKHAIGDKVNSIEAYKKELGELNRDVRDRIEAIEAKHKQMISSGASILTHPEEGANPLTSASTEEEIHVSVAEEEALGPVTESSRNPFALGVNVIKASAAVATATAAAAASSSAAVAAATAAAALSTAAAALGGEEDGDFFEGGFVAFSKLSVVHAALQMVHSAPFAIETFAAPDPEDSKYREYMSWEI